MKIQVTSGRSCCSCFAILGLLVIVFCIGPGRSLAQTPAPAPATAPAPVPAQTVFLICTWDTSSIYEDRTGKEKFERRFYVSPTVSMTKDEFLHIDSEGERIEGLCSQYLENTVILAASDRGERVDTSGHLTVIRNIELSGENLGSKNMYSLATREAVEKKRDDAVKEMTGANRIVMTFNWDLSGKAEADDLAREKKRTLPSVTQKP